MDLSAFVVPSHAWRLPVVEPQRTTPSLGSSSPSRGKTALSAAVVISAFLSVKGRSRRGLRPSRTASKGFGPQSEMAQEKEVILSKQIGSRLSYVMLDNMDGILAQLQQYGFAQVDGFLGDNGYAQEMRSEMKSMFDRGWFESEPEDDAFSRIGPYKIQNQDLEHRFRARIKGTDGMDNLSNNLVQNQYDIAPTTIEFVRGLTVSAAGPIGKKAGCEMKENMSMSEIFVLCGEGARYDRRCNNVHGWNTQATGFVPDSRKLTAFYFTNPNYKQETGGLLQLEGVVTPTGAVQIAPMADRLVLFWADKTVWSMTPSRAKLISDFQFGITMSFMVKDQKDVKYDAKSLAQWWPELRGQTIPDES